MKKYTILFDDCEEIRRVKPGRRYWGASLREIIPVDILDEKTNKSVDRCLGWRMNGSTFSYWWTKLIHWKYRSGVIKGWLD